MKIRKILEIIFIFLLGSVTLYGKEPPTILKLKIPDYRIDRVGELDYVDIPGGEILMAEEGRPCVPYYCKSIDYPKGYRVQNVVLEEKTGLVTKTGLNLPVVIQSPNPSLPIKMKEGIYPEKDYEWKLWRNPDGSTTLVISLYPFYYDPKTTEVKFYKNYQLGIKYIKTAFLITRLMTDKYAYVPGEKVGIKIKLENTGKPQDIIVAGVIKQEFSGEMVTELPSKEMRGVSKIDSVALEWQTKDFPSGDYYVEVSLKDLSGNILDREMEKFRLGISGCVITGFKVTPEHFKIGDNIQLSLDFKNSGSCEISGNAIFEIKNEKSIVKIFSHEFSKLAPGNVLNFAETWNTKEAVKGILYYVLGYVKYEGTATPPMKTIISTNLMPVAKFNYSPEKPIVGKEISFDATGSKDEDGKIVEYNWDFGDGGTGSGDKVTHTYYLPGDYDVNLMVKDNENGIGKVSHTITVGEEK